MNKNEILTNALYAVNFRLTEARNQVNSSRDLGDKKVIQYWEREVEMAEATYQGLLAMWSDHMDSNRNGEGCP
ncbi:hypothetical protein [Endozoicomonas sp. 4G]|uniref:hypothetical protein n=1 Tax=Endozoicomonas sp. 4G TaxID=2872754 RepID=UPI00207865D4|nr:hypothetical protein [Endozoicomonas sp. 4G]